MPIGSRSHELLFLLDMKRKTLYDDGLIKTSASTDTERLFRCERVKRFESVERQAQRKLAMIGAAKELRDLSAAPGNRLEELFGNRAGQYSIRINDQWRVCFVWKDGDAYDVEITDYHYGVKAHGQETTTGPPGGNLTRGVHGTAQAEHEQTGA